jgi:hypothetical protein
MSNHNKSNKSLISIVYAGKEQVKSWKNTFEQRLVSDGNYYHPGLCEESYCFMMASQKGRLTIKQKDVCYGYQLVAFYKYGRELMKLVTASKGKDDLSISHLCGTRYCCNPSHIILEPKWVNDQRVCCHFAMKSLLEGTGDWEVVKEFLGNGGCPHNPQCGTDEYPYLNLELPFEDLIFDAEEEDKEGTDDDDDVAE